jgi:hypothetical protein
MLFLFLIRDGGGYFPLIIARLDFRSGPAKPNTFFNFQIRRRRECRPATSSMKNFCKKSCFWFSVADGLWVG